MKSFTCGATQNQKIAKASDCLRYVTSLITNPYSLDFRPILQYIVCYQKLRR